MLWFKAHFKFYPSKSKLTNFPNLFTLIPKMPLYFFTQSGFRLRTSVGALLAHLPRKPTLVPPTFTSLHLSYKLRPAAAGSVWGACEVTVVKKAGGCKSGWQTLLTHHTHLHHARRQGFMCSWVSGCVHVCESSRI